MSQIEDLLRRCTVKITVPDGWGTGFFVAPGLVLTCAHVMQRSTGQVQLWWQNQSLDATVERSLPEPYDLALLRVVVPTDLNPPCVKLNEEVQSRDPLYLFGYPDEGDRQGEPRTFNCDGITGSEAATILFNLGQVRPGMSGSALLNQRTRMVCGMVKFTRDRNSDLGGGAIPTEVILDCFPQLRKLQQAFHECDHRWSDLPILDVLQTIVQEEEGVDILRQNYRDVMPDDAHLWVQPADDPAQMVKILRDYQQLPSFVQRLIKENKRLSQPLRNQLNALKIEPVGPSKGRQVSRDPLVSLQSYLLITVRANQQAVDAFVVNGWLIPNDAEQNKAERFKLLDLAELQIGETCAWHEIPHLVDRLVDLSLTHLRGKQFDLTIEIFLPLGSLHEAVDGWEITDLGDEKIPIGTKYPVVVRTSDRLTPNYVDRRLSDWYKNWERVRALGDTLPNPDQDFEHLDGYDGINWKRLQANLTQKVGLKVTCGLPEQHRNAVITAMHGSATPIAIWSRCSLAHLDLVGEMNRLLSENLLSENRLTGLAEAVRQKRLDADCEESPDAHLGSHLGILWENPHRLPPDAMTQLKVPQ
jgi:vWA-MoxR associated protein C-terminal domain/Trypsin-like peptidase domain